MADLSGTQKEGGGNWQSGYTHTRSNTVTWATLADANDDVVMKVNKGEILLGIAAKVIAGGDKASTIEVGVSGGDTDGYMAAFSVANAAVGDVNIGAGALMGGTIFAADADISALSAVVAGPNTEPITVKFTALYAKVEA